jgi:surface protein
MIINLAEVEAYTSNGSLITPVRAELSSTDSLDGQARNCIDGARDSICHSWGASQEAPWLLIDFGTQVDIALILVYNRVDCCDARINGARISVSNSRAGDTESWEATINPAHSVKRSLVSTFDLGKLATSRDGAGARAVDKYGQIEVWDVSKITNFNHLFSGLFEFEVDLNRWNTSSVTGMVGMFQGVPFFNKPLGNWDTSQVKAMGENDGGGAFSFARTFNQDINNWDISSVTSARSMFEGAFAFNQDLNAWNVGRLRDAGQMFAGSVDGVSGMTTSFNSNLNAWDTSQITDMRKILRGSIVFNGDVSNWNTVKVVAMNELFRGCQNFNGDLSKWQVGKVTGFHSAFEDAHKFDSSLSEWDVGSVIDFSRMFYSALKFSHNLGCWNQTPRNDLSTRKNPTGRRWQHAMFSWVESHMREDDGDHARGMLPCWHMHELASSADSVAGASGYWYGLLRKKYVESCVVPPCCSDDCAFVAPPLPPPPLPPPPPGVLAVCVADDRIIHTYPDLLCNTSAAWVEGPNATDASTEGACASQCVAETRLESQTVCCARSCCMPALAVETTTEPKPSRNSSTKKRSAAVGIGITTSVILALVVTAVLLGARRRNRRGRNGLAGVSFIVGEMERRSVAACTDMAESANLLRQLKHGTGSIANEFVLVARERAEARFVIEYRQLVRSRSMAEFQESFRALEVPRTALKQGGEIGRGQSGAVVAGTLEIQPSSANENGAAAGTLAKKGSGSARLASGRQVAVKFRLDADKANTNPVADEALLLEALLLSGLRHAGIVELVAVVTNTAPVLLCMELMPNGDLRGFLRACRPDKLGRPASITPTTMTCMAAKLASAMAFMEQQSIVHRDLAARNVLVGEGEADVKIADLGAARNVHRTSETSYKGVYTATTEHNPARWMPLEALQSAEFSHKSDVFAFGVLLWEILSLGQTPWGAFQVPDFVAALQTGDRLQMPRLVESDLLAQALYRVGLRCWVGGGPERSRFAHRFTVWLLSTLLDDAVWCCHEPGAKYHSLR